MNEATIGTEGYYSAEACDLGEFTRLISQQLDPGAVPHAAEIVANIPVYDMAALRDLLAAPSSRRALMAEWARVLRHSAGIIILKSACENLDAIDAASAAYERIIATEKAANAQAADHFAAAGHNDRIWNSLQKLCEADPETFIAYFANPAIDAACEAWLGPNYQMTAQVNLVHPGGAAQQAHRDYHLGFQTAETSALYPAHVHDLSPLLTLQGGIAHCDAPIEAGPTKLLPFSQAYSPGYAAWRRPDFRACFEENCVQVPLEKGDALFFNPALFHAAGANRTENVERLVNLLQVSSAFGRAMETIDRTAMCRLLYPHLAAMWSSGQIDEARLDAVIAASAEGYPFPTNLDSDPPVGGLAPPSQQMLLKQAVLAGWQADEFERRLDEQQQRRQP